MSYKEKILISLEADKTSVEAFNSQMELVEKKAKELGITIDKSMGAIFAKFSKGTVLNIDTTSARKKLTYLGQKMDLLSARKVSVSVDTTNAEANITRLTTSLKEIQSKTVSIDVVSTEAIQGLKVVDVAISAVTDKVMKLKQELVSLAVKSDVSLTATVKKVKVDSKLTGDKYVKLRILITDEEVKRLYTNLRSTIKAMNPIQFGLGYTKKALNTLLKSIKSDLAGKDIPLYFTIANVPEIIQDFNEIKNRLSSKTINLKIGLRSLTNIKKTLTTFRARIVNIVKTEANPWKVNITKLNLGTLDKQLASLKETLKAMTGVSIVVKMGEGITQVKTDLGYINSQLTKFKQKQYIKIGVDETTLGVIEKKLINLRDILGKRINITFAFVGIKTLKKEIAPLLKLITEAQTKLGKAFNADSFAKIALSINSIAKDLPKATSKVRLFNKALKDVPTKSFSNLSRNLTRLSKTLDNLTEKSQSFREVWQVPLEASFIGNLPSQLNIMAKELNTIKTMLKSLRASAKKPITPTINMNIDNVDSKIESMKLNLKEIDTLTITPHLESRSIIAASANMIKFEHRAEELRAQLMIVQQEMMELGHITIAEANAMSQSIQKMTNSQIMFGESAKTAINAFGMSVNNVSGLFTKLTGVGASAGQQLSEVFGGAKASVLRSQLEAMNLTLKNMGVSSEAVDANMRKLNNTTNSTLLSMDLVANGIKSINLSELFNTKKFKSLAPDFLTGNVKQQLNTIKAELRSYNSAMLNTDNITEKTFKKMEKRISSMTAGSIKDISKLKGAMTSLGSTTSALRGVFVQLTRVFIASMYAKQMSQYLDDINKVKQAVLSFETNLAYDELADQMERISAVTGGAVTKLALLPAVNKALALGVDMTNGRLLNLVEMTTKMSQAFGTDSVQAFSDFTTAISKGSAIVLDNIGVLLRQEEAQKLEYKALGISTISFNKWRAALTQAQKRAVYMKWGIIKLSEKTRDLTLTTTEYSQAVGTMKDQWDNFGQTLSQNGGFSLAILAVERLTAVLYSLETAIELASNAFLAMGMMDDYKGLNTIQSLSAEVTNLADGVWQAKEIMRFFRLNLKALTVNANQARLSMTNLAKGIAVTATVQQDILDNKQWVKDLNELVGVMSILKGSLDEVFITMTKGSSDVNIVKRSFDRYLNTLGKTGDVMKDIGDIESSLRVFGGALSEPVEAMYQYYNMVKAIGDIDVWSKEVDRQKKFIDTATTTGDLLSVLAGKGIGKKVFGTVISEGLGAYTNYAVKINYHNKSMSKSMITLKRHMDEYRIKMGLLAQDRNMELFMKRALKLGKNLGVAGSKMRKLVSAYQLYAKETLKTGKVPQLFTQFFIDRLKETNSEVGKISKKLEGLFEQWIKLKRSAEASTMGGFDKKLATLSNNYRDQLKKVEDLYSKIQGYQWDTFFPDFTRGTTDVKDYYQNFKNIAEDIEALGKEKFIVKYSLGGGKGAIERANILMNLSKGFAKQLKEMYEEQQRFTFTLSMNYIKSKNALQDAKFAASELALALAPMTKRIEDLGKIGKQGIFDFSGDTERAQSAIDHHYTVLESRIHSYYKNIVKVRDAASIEELKQQLRIDKKALAGQYSNTKLRQAAEEKLGLTYLNKRNLILTESKRNVNEKLKELDAQKLADQKAVLDAGIQQYATYAEEMNKTMLKTGEFRAIGKVLKFDPKALGWYGITDFLTNSNTKLNEMRNSFKALIPTEYKTALKIDVDTNQLVAVQDIFKEMGVEDQQKIKDIISKLNPAMKSMAEEMAKPATLFKDTMLDAIKEIGNALGSFASKMLWARTDAFNGFEQTRKESLESINQERANGLITQTEYEAQSAAISNKFNQDKANYEKEARKEVLLSLAQSFWAKGVGLGIEGVVNIASGNAAMGAAQIAGGASLASLASALGYWGASIQTSSAASQAAQATNRGDRDRYITINNSLFEDELSLTRTVTHALEEY